MDAKTRLVHEVALLAADHELVQIESSKHDALQLVIMLQSLARTMTNHSAGLTAMRIGRLLQAKLTSPESELHHWLNSQWAGSESLLGPLPSQRPDPGLRLNNPEVRTDE